MTQLKILPKVVEPSSSGLHQRQINVYSDGLVVAEGLLCGLSGCK